MVWGSPQEIILVRKYGDYQKSFKQKMVFGIQIVDLFVIMEKYISTSSAAMTFNDHFWTKIGTLPKPTNILYV